MVLTLVSSSTETSNTSDWMSSSARCVSSASRHRTEFSLSSNSDRIYNVINLMKNLPLGNIYSKNQYCTNTWMNYTVWTNLYLSKTKKSSIKELPLPMQLIWVVGYDWVLFFTLNICISYIYLLSMFKTIKLTRRASRLWYPPLLAIVMTLGVLGSLRGVYNLCPFPYLHSPVVVGSWMAFSALRLY